MILLLLALFCLITRLWPLLFLVIPGILIAALRLLFVSAKKTVEAPATDVTPPAPQYLDTEQDVIRIAFGILQRRITMQIVSSYTSARWVWESPNAMERFKYGLPLTILLSRAGGLRRAIVRVQSLQFTELVYETAQTGRPDEPPPEIDADGDPGCGCVPEYDEPVDYALIAFQWVESNLLTLNNCCNEAVAENLISLLIPACDLPHPDSWCEVCEELKRNGFAEAVIQDGGIRVQLPK